LNQGEQQQQQQQQQRGSNATGHPSSRTTRIRTGIEGDSGQVELRKLVSRFQTFLNQEIAWYLNAISEWVRVFGFEDDDSVMGWLRVVGVITLNEEESTNSIPKHRYQLGAEEGEKKLGLIHKALICLGDLERYKEQYGLERERRKKNGENGDGKERYGGAKRFYEVARGLSPDNGEFECVLYVVLGRGNWIQRCRLTLLVFWDF
jgi:hypothetical protein